jgi:type IV pilus assembly protein PilV
MVEMRCRRHARTGFTMIEVLVTLFVIALGLLGLAALQNRIYQAEFEAYNRAQALVLLDAIVNRINANRATAPCYAITTNGGTPYLGVPDAGHASTITCNGYGDATTQQLAVNDLIEWDRVVQGTTELVGATAVGAALGARGCIGFDPVTSTYTVAVAWQGIAATSAPSVSCGNNLYGSETRRRVVWATLKIATLL